MVALLRDIVQIVTLTLLLALTKGYSIPSNDTAELSARATTQLKILPWGDSITFGWWGSTGNGYRLPLLNMLQNAGYSVQYIGSRPNGQMYANLNEGWPGATINQVHSDGLPSLQNSGNAPNLILLHAGTNDANNAVANNQVNPNGVRTAVTMANDLDSLVADVFKFAPKTYCTAPSRKCWWELTVEIGA